MIRKSISRSSSFSCLSIRSQVIFCMIIPHQNTFGKLNGELHFIKGEVCPKIKWATIRSIEKCLKEITKKTSMKWFKFQGLNYIHSLDFFDHNEVRDDRKGKDDMPDFIQPQDKSGGNAGAVPLGGGGGVGGGDG